MKTNSLQILIITCHNVYNFGATLQAYALSKYLSDIGNDAEIIDYRPEYLTFNLWAIGDKWKRNIVLKTLYFLYVIPRRLRMQKRRDKFDAFTKSKLPVTKAKFNSISDLKNETPKADIYIAGSDQIWNPLLPNGKDPAFFLEFANENSVKLSYAASFSVTELPNDTKGRIKNWLSKLDYISVRESSAIPILENLEVNNAEVVVDPVFLLKKGTWENLAKSPKIENYIFVYDQENSKLIRSKAKELKKRYNLKIVAIEALYPMTYADKRIKDAGPEDFLGLIKNSEICLTNSFHCLSFSLIFNKRFYLFKRTHLNVNSRMVDLLNDLNLNNRIITDGKSDLNIDDLEYIKIDALIERKKQSSISFIEKGIIKAMEKEMRNGL